MANSVGFNPRYGYSSSPANVAAASGAAQFTPPSIPAKKSEETAGFFPPPPGMAWYNIDNNITAPLMPAPPPYTITPTINPAPPNDHGGFPGTHLPNPSIPGATGLPWGYNYIFPQQNTVIHVLQSSRPPWRITADHPIKMIPCTVPTCITVKELMKSLGCDNAVAGKNVLYEITEAGNGRWHKGMVVKGDNAAMVGKTLGEIGWGVERNGRDEDFVWLFLTKD